MRPFLPAPAAFPEPPPEDVIARAEIVDLSDRLERDGRLVWDAPAGEWEILRFGRRSTGANTRPAPRPGLGLECDKLDPAALDAHFDAFVGRLVREVGPRPLDRAAGWTSLHIDSWEMGAQNWTAGFGAEFRGRRGYDPLPYVPAMTGRVAESVEISERFLWDLRLTLQELVIENHAAHLRDLGRRHGFRLSIEPYDMNPTADLTLGGVADVPMGEFWAHGHGFDSAFSCVEAASIAHTTGRSIVGAEAFTAGESEAWRLYPALLKDQGDWALCAGINRVVFHRFAHQPWLDRRPGMTMGPYGVHWDRTQTWWPLAGAYHRYLARCQFLLRQGAPVADVCYLVPEGAPHVFRPPASALAGELPDRRGFAFDGCAPEALVAGARVEEERIVFPGGAAYRLLVLPAVETMTPRLLRAVAALVAAGATIAGSPPQGSPSLEEYPRCDEEVAELAAELWGGRAPSAEVVRRSAGTGAIVWGGELQVAGAAPDGTPELYPTYEATARLLAALGTPPDFASDGPLRYAHRRTADADLYFVANRTAREIDAAGTFRVTGRRPERWDPLTGAIHRLATFAERDGRTTVPLRFAPHQSWFVVFRAEPTAGAPVVANGADRREPSLLARIDGPWDVFFAPENGGPGSVRFATLGDWRESADPQIRHYAGIATYTGAFDLPGLPAAGPRRLVLDIGEVPDLARIRLNGADLGILWCAPWRVEVAAAARAGGNRLEIDVASLWPNRLIGDCALPPEEQVAWTTWNPYGPGDPLLPSGLLGPVRILAGE
ncbi:MAG: glycosyl hydrolase [Planctomycetota bacterium]